MYSHDRSTVTCHKDVVLSAVASFLHIPNRNPYSKVNRGTATAGRRAAGKSGKEVEGEDRPHAEEARRTAASIEDAGTKFVTRLARFFTGHFPHGEFRARFKQPGRTTHYCGNPGIETRDHIMFECPLWWRPWNPGIPVDNPDNGALLPATRQEKMPKLDAVKRFLRVSPMITTFEWYDLINHAEKDLEEGKGNNTYAGWRVRLETTLRQKAHWAWQRLDLLVHSVDKEEGFSRIWDAHRLALHM